MVVVVVTIVVHGYDAEADILLPLGKLLGMNEDAVAVVDEYLLTSLLAALGTPIEVAVINGAWSHCFASFVSCFTMSELYRPNSFSS